MELVVAQSHNLVPVHVHEADDEERDEVCHHDVRDDPVVLERAHGENQERVAALAPGDVEVVGDIHGDEDRAGERGAAFSCQSGGRSRDTRES